MALTQAQIDMLNKFAMCPTCTHFKAQTSGPAGRSCEVYPQLGMSNRSARRCAVYSPESYITLTAEELAYLQDASSPAVVTKSPRETPNMASVIAFES